MLYNSFVLKNRISIQDYQKIESKIRRINEETREVNLNGDDKRFWLGRLVDINYNKSNNSTSLNPEFFAERFELNDDYLKDLRSTSFKTLE